MLVHVPVIPVPARGPGRSCAASAWLLRATVACLVSVSVPTAAVAQVLPRSSQNRSPAADAGGPYAVAAGRDLVLSALRSFDPDDDSLAFAWDLGDGSVATGPTPTHAFARAGSYPVTLLVADGRGGVASAETRVVVGGDAGSGNKPPFPAHNGPWLAAAGETILFDASGSTDPDRDWLACAWTFGDGTAASGMTVRHAYEQAGRYSVSLLLTDGRGGASAMAATAVIGGPAVRARNVPPVAQATAAEKAMAGAPVKFDGSLSFDPDGDPLTLTWTFDDGQSVAGREVTHVFSGGGIHIARLMASDDQGAVATVVLSIKVGATEGNQVPIPAIGGPYAGMVNSAVAFDAGGSRDPDGDELTFSWDFGDGTPGADGSAAQHAFIKAGTYVVTAIVRDDNGGSVPASTRAVISAPPGPANAPPVADAGGRYKGSVGKPLEFNGSLSSDPDKDTLACAWAFGDGATANGTTVAHVYAYPGTYEVLLLVSDGKGGSSASLATAVIAGSPAGSVR